MATVDQIQRGITNFIDVEFAPQLDSAKTRWLVGGMGALLADNVGKVLEAKRDTAGMALLGIYTENGEVDLEALYKAFAPKMTEPIKFDVPLVGRITIRREDIDRLVQHIREA